jgi:hypothetical protein
LFGEVSGEIEDLSEGRAGS